MVHLPVLSAARARSVAKAAGSAPRGEGPARCPRRFARSIARRPGAGGPGRAHVEVARGAAIPVALAAIAVALVGCEPRKAEFSGVGPWSVVKTQRKDATGVCQPTELPDGRAGTWCFRQRPFGIGKKAAEVDLYFLGSEPTAPLIELQLKVRGCVEDDVEAWLRQNFGAPYERRGTRAYWRNARMFLAAFLPQDPGRCVLRMLPLSEGAEIERIKLL